MTFMLAASAGGHAAAAEHLICFDPGSTTLSSSGYAGARRVAEDFRPSPGGRKNLTIQPSADGDMGAERVAEVRLELMRLGVNIGRMRTASSHGAAPPDCLRVSVSDVTAGTPPYMVLWHFWGPYFGRGEVEVDPEWRSRLRFIVADYRPGVTRYCIGGHSDTEPDELTALELSRRRAENVQRELVRHGVRWEDTEVRAYGETQLARPTSDGVAEPLNRRVIVDVRERCPPSH
ncbi:MAG: OmpA family protein [Brevundimonas sp.]